LFCGSSAGILAGIPVVWEAVNLRKIQHAILVQHEKGFTEKRFTEKLVGMIFKPKLQLHPQKVAF
jgi:hypothetical protein